MIDLDLDELERLLARALLPSPFFATLRAVGPKNP